MEETKLKGQIFKINIIYFINNKVIMIGGENNAKDI
jgi:hypothetical protein